MMFLSPMLKEHGQKWRLEDLDTGSVLASRALGAFDSRTRRQGLLGRQELVDEALILAPCNAVHTFFMRFPIDILFTDREGRIVRVTRSLGPWRMAAAWRAFATIELPAGTVDRSGTRPGHRVAVRAQAGD